MTEKVAMAVTVTRSHIPSSSSSSPSSSALLLLLASSSSSSSCLVAECGLDVLQVVVPHGERPALIPATTYQDLLSQFLTQ